MIKKQRGKEKELQDSHSRLQEVRCRLGAVEEEGWRLRARVAMLEEGNRVVKEEYDRLQLLHHALEQQLCSRQLEASELIPNLLQLKAAAAQRENQLIEKPRRIEHRNLQEDLAMVSSLPISDETAVARRGPASPPEEAKRQDSGRSLRGTRSASFSLPAQHKFLQSVKGIFRMRSSASCSEIDCSPSGFFSFTRIPAQVRHSVTAHDGEVNAVKFSPNSKIVATGGSDRKVKLWAIVGGTLQDQKTLEGSNDGVTSIEFDPSGLHLLAGSYDNTARLWSLKDCELKQTLSGHGAKVTSAKFKFYLHEAVTGSHDRTLKIWDLNKPACVKSLQAPSRCSDVVCSSYLVISGHYDKTIRFWDTRSGVQTDELGLLDRVTSLDISLDRMQLLSCSRDDTLTLIDLRMNRQRRQLRAEGFKCGADSTKAIFSPDGNFAAAGSSDGSLHFWDVLTGSVVTSLSGQHRSSINAVSWSLSGEYMVSVDRTKMANLWTEY
ncbi:ATG16 autophagy related 16-like 2 [Rhinoraja longicauda]